MECGGKKERGGGEGGMTNLEGNGIYVGNAHLAFLVDPRPSCPNNN